MRVDQIEKPQSMGPEYLWLICFLAIAPALFLLPINHDAIWQIWIGRKLLHGATLYTDIIEVNPPLWFWMAVPLAGVGEMFAIEARLIVIGFFIAAIGLSLFLTPARYRLLLFGVLVLMPLRDFGQREHFTLIATAPYVFTIAARKEGREVGHPLLIGLFAAFGFALKPYFAIAPLALELLIWSKPRVRPETLALALSAIAYSVAVWIFAPAYITDIVPMVRKAYGSFQGNSTLTLLVTTFGIAAVGAILGMRKGCNVTRALVVTALAFLFVVLIQNKGWEYHSIPARGFLLLAIVIELLRHRGRPTADAFLIAAAILCLHSFGLYRNPFRAEAEQHLAGVPPHATVAVLSTNPMMAWPMVEERRLNWSLSQMGLWQLNAVVFSDQYDLRPELRRTVARDLSSRPDLVVIDRRRLLGPALVSLLPSDFQANYTVKLRTARMESYTLNPKSDAKR